MNNYSMNVYHYSGQGVPPGQYSYVHNWSSEEQKHQGTIPSISSQPTQSPAVPLSLVKEFMAIIKKGNIGEIESFMSLLSYYQ